MKFTAAMLKREAHQKNSRDDPLGSSRVQRSGNCQMNIARYRKLLETSLDKPTRATVERLLANERAHRAECKWHPGFPSAFPIRNLGINPGS